MQQNPVFNRIVNMAHMYEIASYLEAVIIIKGFEVVRRNAMLCPGVMVLNVLKNKELVTTIIVDKQCHGEYFDEDSFFLIRTIEDAERLVENFDAIIS